MRRGARFCDQKIGSNRIGVALSVTIIVIALLVLHRILRNINSREVIEALVATDWRHVTLAALFVAGSYFALTFYDLFALRTIGRNHTPTMARRQLDWETRPISRFHATPGRATGLAASRRKSSVSGRRSATSFRWATFRGYLNLKGYKEFEAEHRASGWNTWLTFAISGPRRARRRKRHRP